MLSLNLISPQQQRYLKIKYLHLLIKNFLGLLIILSAILAIVLVFINANIKNLGQGLDSLKTAAVAQNQSQNLKIDQLNKKIADLEKISAAAYNWPLLLKELALATPEGVSLIELSANAEVKNFIIRGYAQTREQLITFKSNLDNIALFKKVESPLANYLEKANVTFEIKGELE